ncbi:beta-lactoglobulin-2-like [Sorex araneus]|uniref:beta-lactoglobulin-2-like n=1 Tax=Sorex araneus TaxID=42254 RepID=UPI002433AE47|nr:beta-lactoglobulin-2-like [Sorex araneus]
MKCILLALALVCGIQATAIPQATNLDIQKMTGTWYTVAMAASYAPLLDKDSSFRVFVKDLKVTPQENMEITLSKQVKQDCVDARIMAQKTQDPAVFTVNYDDGEKKVTVLDTDYTHFMVFCMEAPMAGTQQGTVCQYMTRTMNPEQGEMMASFSRTLQVLPTGPQIILSMVQMEEKCRV